MNYVRLAKVLAGGVLGGAVGYGVYYIWQKKPWKKEQGEVVYEAPKNAEEWRESKTVAEQVAEDAAQEVIDSVESVQEVKKLVENYIPSQHGGWVRSAVEKDDMDQYVYYAEDEILADSDMDEIDDDLFDAVLQLHSAWPAAKRLILSNADSGETACVTVTNEDYAAAYNRWSDAKFEAGDILYPEEE